MASVPKKPPVRRYRRAGGNHLYVTLDPELIKAAKMRAIDKSVTTSRIVELALRSYLKLGKKDEE